MTTDTLLAFREKHPEAWPEGLEYVSDLTGWRVCQGTSRTGVGIPTNAAHAIIADKVMEACRRKRRVDFVFDRGKVWVQINGGKITPGPTRLEALIAAYKAEVANA